MTLDLREPPALVTPAHQTDAYDGNKIWRQHFGIYFRRSAPFPRFDEPQSAACGFRCGLRHLGIDVSGDSGRRRIVSPVDRSGNTPFRVWADRFSDLVVEDESQADLGGVAGHDSNRISFVGRRERRSLPGGRASVIGSGGAPRCDSVIVDGAH